MPDSTVQRVLIADDDKFVRELVVHILANQGIDVTQVEDGAAAIERLEQGFDAAIVDLDMPHATGLEVLAVASARVPDLPVMVLSGAGDIADAVTALKRGAFDYLTKPFESEELLARVREALRVSRLERENQALRTADASPAVQIVAESDATREIMALAQRCTEVDSNVLITGPSGTGKSILARWIHQNSRRAAGPFVTVNCAALPRELIESELFGHERGAFTGAAAARVGRFEAAHAGTILLDEVGELPLDLQPKLLHVLQERVITRVGATLERPIDVRIIAATNRDLETAVAEDRFREDLFYRLNVLNLQVPNLAARPDEIIPLAEHHIQRISRRVGVPVPTLSEDAADTLQRYNWPGNVRELENILERAVVFATDQTILPQQLGPLSTATPTFKVQDLIGIPIAEIERQLVSATLEHCAGNRAEAGKLLGLSERTIYNRLKQYAENADTTTSHD